jgi:hypothetical protein
VHFVTKEQIDHFYMKFKGKDIVDMNEMLEVFEEIFDHPAPSNTLSEARKNKITHSLFTNPGVIKDLREAAEDTELIFNEEEIMQIVHEVQNDRSKL